jgi:hypothetical protein
MIMFARIALASVAAIALSASALAAPRAPAEDRQGIAVNGTGGKPLGIEQTRESILRGAKARGWSVQRVEAGKVTLELHDGQRVDGGSQNHLVIDIHYRAGAMDLRYVGSSDTFKVVETGGKRTADNGYRKRLDRLMAGIADAARVVSAMGGTQ